MADVSCVPPVFRYVKRKCGFRLNKDDLGTITRIDADVSGLTGVTLGDMILKGIPDTGTIGQQTLPDSGRAMSRSYISNGILN
jgi:hypothetical protein